MWVLWVIILSISSSSNAGVNWSSFQQDLNKFTLPSEDLVLWTGGPHWSSSHIWHGWDDKCKWLLAAPPSFVNYMNIFTPSTALFILNTLNIPGILIILFQFIPVYSMPEYFPTPAKNGWPRSWTWFRFSNHFLWFPNIFSVLGIFDFWPKMTYVFGARHSSLSGYTGW